MRTDLQLIYVALEQQLKTIHRLILAAQDDLGDLATAERELESRHDDLVAIECLLDALRTKLATHPNK